MENPKVLWSSVLGVALILSAVVVVEHRARGRRKLAELRAGVAARVADMEPMSSWTREEVDRFLQDVGEGGIYDWIVQSSRASPDSYREWYQLGGHRMDIPEDRRLEPAYARETLGRIAACLRKGDFDDASHYMREVEGEMDIVPFRPRTPSR